MTDPIVSKIGQILIPVSDLARAVQFYKNTLGMTFLFEFPHMAFFDCGGVRLLLETVKKGETKDFSTFLLYYQTPDIHGACQRLAEQGVQFHDQPHIVHQTDTYNLWMAFFKDSEGNMLALMQEKSK